MSSASLRFSLNPFNGIESVRGGEVKREMDEGVMNPFNGIERLL